MMLHLLAPCIGLLCCICYKLASEFFSISLAAKAEQRVLEITLNKNIANTANFIER
jgi:hypothetical protein